MERPSPTPIVAGLALVVIYAALCVAHGRAVEHFTVLNDFWGNAFAADHWQWNARRLWNGFFPPGYPFVLTVLPGPRMLESAYHFNVAAGVGLLLGVWLALRRWISDWAAALGVALVAFHPMIVTQVLTTGPDAAFVAGATAGALLLFHVAVVSGEPSVRVAVLAGLALGGAGWFRYHAYPWAGALLVAAVLAGGTRRLRFVLSTAAAIAVAGLGLVVLGLAAGDLLSLQRDQAFNTYTRLVEAPNWFHLPAPGTLPATVGEAIARNPAAFRQNYLAFSRPHLWLLAAPLAGLVVARGTARRFAGYTLAATVLFVPVVDLGASPRGVACVVPLMLVAAAWTVADVVQRAPTARARLTLGVAATAAVAAFAWTQWKPENDAYLAAVRSRHATSRTLEAALRRDRVSYAMQVFSTTDLYFLGATGWDVPAYHPRVIGGWPTVDLPGYLETYPEPSTASLDAFLDDCQRFGITHLALGGASFLAQPELGQLFDGRLSTPRVQEIDGGVSGVRLFRIVG